MSDIVENFLTPEDKKRYIDAFLPHLAALRARAGISQDELSNMVGISRQTYGTVERSLRDLSWNTFLSLLLFFDYNSETHDVLRACGAFPTDLIAKFNAGNGATGQNALDIMFSEEQKRIMDELDDQALRAIKTTIMLEYGRCAQLSSDAVIKAFDGVNFNLRQEDAEADQALKMIRMRKKK